MRPRNREVNIFNMSLLDILCGALGAFCFMMLSLFPYQSKAKELEKRLAQAQASSGAGMQQQVNDAKKRAEDAEKETDKAKRNQSLAYFMVAWNGPQDVDVWVESSSGGIFTSKQELVPPDKRMGKVPDRTKGPGQELVWMSDVAYEGREYRLFARLASANGDPTPVDVHGYMTARVALTDENDVMGLRDFGTLTLSREQERVEFGRVRFGNTDSSTFQFFNGPKAAANGTPPPAP